MKSTSDLRRKMRAAYCTKVPDLTAYAESFAICGAGGPLAAVLDDLDTLEAKLAEYKGLYESEYNHTSEVREKLAWQAEMLERGRALLMREYRPIEQHDDWLADLERGMPAGEGEKG